MFFEGVAPSDPPTTEWAEGLFEARMVHHGASDSKLKPKGRNIKNIKKTKDNCCFVESPGFPGRPNMRPRWFQVGLKLG